MYNSIRTAANTLAGIVYRTPLVHSELFSHFCQSQVYFKLENLQKTGGYNLRGAYNKIAGLTRAELETGLITTAYGNQALALAYAANLLGLANKTTVFVPKSTSKDKINGIRGYGVNVQIRGDTYVAAKEYAEQETFTTGATYITLFDDLAVIAGNGTIGLEIVEDLPEVEIIVVPVENMGLLAGVAVAAKSIKPNIQIFGAKTRSSTLTLNPLHINQSVERSIIQNVADSLEVEEVGSMVFNLIHRWVDGMVVVSNALVEQAVGQLLDGGKLLVEDTGALGLAALNSGALPFDPTTKVALVLSGGNIDLGLISCIIKRRMLKTGKLAHFRLVVSQGNRTLGQLLHTIEEMGGKIVKAERVEYGNAVGSSTIKVELLIDTFNAAHRDEIINYLKESNGQIELL